MQKYKYSFVIPVYNRPDEIEELLDSITKLEQPKEKIEFEVVVVEDGSTVPCKDIVDKYSEQLNIKYFFKSNSGQGLSRNFGVENANGDFIITTDSDCILPSHYIKTVNEYVTKEYLDAFGGPDMAHNSFNNFQKAASYAMTSFFTTGGIRNKNKSLGGKYEPRGFNCGIKREIFLKLGGYWDFRPPGEEMPLNYKLRKNGYKVGFIENAFVYHKRRINLTKFFKQVYLFGSRRAMLSKLNPETTSIVHYLPTLFTLFCVFCLVSSFFCIYALSPLVLYALLVFIDSTVKNKSLVIGGLSVITAYIQHFGYGLGFLFEFISRYIFRQKYKTIEEKYHF